MKYLSVLVMVINLAACDDCVECFDGAPPEMCDPQECNDTCFNDMKYGAGFCMSYYDGLKTTETCKCFYPPQNIELDDLECIDGDQTCYGLSIYTCANSKWKLEVDCNELYYNADMCIVDLTYNGSNTIRTTASCTGDLKNKFYDYCGASEVVLCENDYNKCLDEHNLNYCEDTKCYCYESMDCWEQFNEFDCTLTIEEELCDDNTIQKIENDYNNCLNDPVDHPAKMCESWRCQDYQKKNCEEIFNEQDCIEILLTT